MTLKVLNDKQEEESGNKEGGYKLINFIDEEGEHLEERKNFLEKAKKIKEKGKIFKDSNFAPEMKSLV